jgi:GNAT superfamily N-acetyltransferase
MSTPPARVDPPSVTVHPATPDRWDDVAAVLGRRNGDPSTCWCRRFLIDPPPPEGEAPDHRAALHREVLDAHDPPGLIAYVDGSPAGWSRVGLRSTFPLVTGNRALARILTPEPDAWWVTCFVVTPRHRGRGVGAALLRAGLDFARSHHATSLTGHPVDVAALTATRVGASALFTGTLTMFDANGFAEIGRSYPSRPVMRHPLG